jgi:hypothetical protein
MVAAAAFLRDKDRSPLGKAGGAAVCAWWWILWTHACVHADTGTDRDVCLPCPARVVHPEPSSPFAALRADTSPAQRTPHHFYPVPSRRNTHSPILWPPLATVTLLPAGRGECLCLTKTSHTAWHARRCMAARKNQQVRAPAEMAGEYSEIWHIMFPFPAVCAWIIIPLIPFSSLALLHATYCS